MAGLLSLDDVVEPVAGALEGVPDGELPLPVEPAPPEPLSPEPLSLEVELDDELDDPPRLSFL